jgi:hypothetical protein
MRRVISHAAPFVPWMRAGASRLRQWGSWREVQIQANGRAAWRAETIQANGRAAWRAETMQVVCDLPSQRLRRTSSGENQGKSSSTRRRTSGGKSIAIQMHNNLVMPMRRCTLITSDSRARSCDIGQSRADRSSVRGAQASAFELSWCVIKSSGRATSTCCSTSRISTTINQHGKVVFDRRRTSSTPRF